jgi:hypothetical protein
LSDVLCVGFFYFIWLVYKCLLVIEILADC